MKSGPVFAMAGLLALGVWMVAQPTIEQGRRIDPDAHRFVVQLGARQVAVEQRPADDGGYRYHFLGRGELEAMGWVESARYQTLIEQELERWEARPAVERTLLGFFNITSWWNFAWVAVGLAGQAAFFGRMMVQWVVSEKQRQSVVPEIFWWLSFFGGASLFTYFVWRTDIVGVLGQSTGVVVYARNLRLIRKEKRRARRREMEEAARLSADGRDDGAATRSGAAAGEEAAHAGVA